MELISLIACPNVKKSVIRTHYDLSTLFYRLMWGPHIHHGLWSGDESPRVAQLQLTEQMASLAGIQGGERVIDIGCGMGGSSIWLAKKRGCDVTGVTISSVQRSWATASAAVKRSKPRPKFLHSDAETIDFESQSVDVVWSIECTEHLFDKAPFSGKQRDG